jgi:hypothetical protein
MLTDIDEADRATAARIEHAIRARYEHVREEVERHGTPAMVRAACPRRWNWNRYTTPVVAFSAIVAVVALVVIVRAQSGDDDHRRVDTVAEVATTVSSEPRYFLLTGQGGLELQDITGRYAPKLAPTRPEVPTRSRVRSYRDGDTERFLVVETTPGATYKPLVGFQGTTVVTVAGSEAGVTVSGSNSTWVTVGLECGGVNAVGRGIGQSETLAALATLRCGDGGALIDPPTGFSLVADRARDADADFTRIVYLSSLAPGFGMVHLSFSQTPIDANEWWLSSTSAAHLREERVGGRLYHVIDYETTVNGVPRFGSNFSISFNEDGAGVSLSTNGMSLDDALRLADSVKRVSTEEFQSVLDKFASEWRKAVYALPDVVPAGFRVAAYEDRQRASVTLLPPEGGSNYSLNFRIGSDTSPSIPGREGRMVAVGNRTVRVSGFNMAAPPANVGDPVTTSIGFKEVTWSENNVTVTVTTTDGPDVEARLLAIIGGVRIVDEAEWKAFLAAHSEPR